VGDKGKVLATYIPGTWLEFPMNIIVRHPKYIQHSPLHASSSPSFTPKCLKYSFTSKGDVAEGIRRCHSEWPFLGAWVRRKAIWLVTRRWHIGCERWRAVTRRLRGGIHGRCGRTRERSMEGLVWNDDSCLSSKTRVPLSSLGCNFWGLNLNYIFGVLSSILQFLPFDPMFAERPSRDGGKSAWDRLYYP